MKTVILLLILVLLISGCVQNKDSPLNHTTGSEITLTATVKNDIIIPDNKNETVIPENARGVVDLAKKDLAAKLQISETSIGVVRVVPVEWRDTSRGHPEPGMVYAPVITPGYIIILDAEGKVYEYPSDYMTISPPLVTGKK
jgi:ABC-type Fe3+-hydroxamate transport system substrate-binding protein